MLIIDKVNEIFQINYTGEENIEKWLIDFKEATEKYDRQINSILSQEMRSKNNYMGNLARIQK